MTSVRMMFIPFLLSVALNAVSKCEVPSIDKTVVAKVGGESIFLDQLEQLPQWLRNTGEPDKPSATEISRLLGLIRGTVIQQEIRDRGITVTDAAVEQEARGMAAETWKMLEATDDERKKKLSALSTKMDKLRQALLMWKENKNEGERFALNELGPLGIDDKIWEYYKSRIDDPTMWQEIDRGCEYDRNTLVQDNMLAAKRVLLQRKLQEAVVGDIRVDSDEIGRLWELTEYTNKIVIETAFAKEENVLKKYTEKAGNCSAPSADQIIFQTLVLTGGDLVLADTNLHREIILLTSVYCASINAGSVSTIFEVQVDKKYRYAFLRIRERTREKQVQPMPQENRQYLEMILREFKLRRGFEEWLARKTREKVRVIAPRFKEVEDWIGCTGPASTPRERIEY